MGFSSGVAKELRREHQLLKDERAKMEARIQAIEFLLSGEATRLARSRDSTGNAAAGNGATRRRTPNAKQTSLRVSVLQALKESPRVTAADVTRRLEEQGIRVGGATSFRERITHELSRLRRKGVLRKYRNGRYAIKQNRVLTGSEAKVDSTGRARKTPAG